MSLASQVDDLADRIAVEVKGRSVDPLRYDSTNMLALRAALTKRKTTPVDFLVIGDSWSEEPSVAGNLGDNERWFTRFQRQARNVAQPPLVWGGPGFYGPYSEVSGAFTYSGTAALIDHAAGLGRRLMRMSQNATATITVPGTGIDIHYMKGGTSGTFTWKVNSGSETTVDASAVSFDIATLQLRAANGIVPGCTVTIKATGSGVYFYNAGAMIYDEDEAAGLRFWCGAHAGYSTNLINADPYSLGDPNRAWSLVDPDCVFIELGGGDFLNGVDTPAQVQGNLDTLAASIRSHCTKNPTIIYLIQPVIAQQAVTPLATMDEYRQAIKEWAATDGQVTVLDMADLFGTMVGTDTYGVTLGDQTHPNGNGWQMIADAVTRLIFGGEHHQPRPRIIPNTTTLHSTQLALMPDGTDIRKYTP
jgi:hypothetical protein